MCFQKKELKIHENTYFRLESEKKIYLSISDKLFLEKVSILSHPPPTPTTELGNALKTESYQQKLD